MTVAMLLMHRWLPGEQQYALPPMLITRRLAGGKGPFARLDTHEHKGLTTLMHFGFGTSFGAMYALIPRQAPLPAALRGILFALCIWTGSYMGWIPAANILPPASKHPTERNALMIFAHVIWGAVLGLLLERLDPAEPQKQQPQTDSQEGSLYVAAARPAKPAATPAPTTGPAEPTKQTGPTEPAEPLQPPQHQDRQPGHRGGDDAAPGVRGPGPTGAAASSRAKSP